jgi:hypothetical protein
MNRVRRANQLVVKEFKGHQSTAPETGQSHEREMNRVRRANQLVVKEFKDTNQQLQKQVSLMSVR